MLKNTATKLFTTSILTKRSLELQLGSFSEVGTWQFSGGLCDMCIVQQSYPESGNSWGEFEYKPCIDLTLRLEKISKCYSLTILNSLFIRCRFRLLLLFLYRVMTVMFISAIWHGLHGGYFIAFLSFPYFFIGEDLLLKTLRSRLRHRHLLNLYDM